MPKNDQEPSYLQLKDKIEHTILQSRRIFISDAIDNETAAEVINKLWYLELSDPGKPILLVINSPGGSVDSGFAIWDQAKMITSPISTLVTGLAASFGSILSLCAKKGHRFATPNARIMIHQPLLGGVVKGQATDLEIHAKEMLKTRDALIHLYMEESGNDYATIERAIDRDTWMSAEEAKNFGLISQIVNSFEELRKLGAAY